MMTRVPRRRRVASRLIACALLGVIINVVVAWVLVFVHSDSVLKWQGGYFDLARGLQWYEKTVIGYHWVTIDVGEADDSSGLRSLPDWTPSLDAFRTRLHIPSGVPYGDFSLYCYGLPLPSMYTIEDINGKTVNFVDGGFWIRFPKHEWYLPLRIVPARFALSSAFWAMLFFIAGVVPGAVIRSRRIRRGGCARCGYSLRGLSPTTTVCPECGTAIPVISSSPRSGDGL